MLTLSTSLIVKSKKLTVAACVTPMYSMSMPQNNFALPFWPAEVLKLLRSDKNKNLWHRRP
jgi:hypothetical protein